MGSSPRARRLPIVPEAPPAAAGHDYADAFEVRVAEPDPRTAEKIARCALEDAPPPVRATIWIAHRHIARFDLAPRSSPDHIFGWKIVASEPTATQLEAASPLLRAFLVASHDEPTRIALATYISYPRPPVSSVLWRTLAPAHRRVAAYLLEQAAARRSG